MWADRPVICDDPGLWSPVGDLTDEWVFLVELDMPWHPVVVQGLLEPAEVHQAAGVVIAQLGVSAVDAIARLRGHAALINRPLPEVALGVLAGRLQLHP